MTFCAPPASHRILNESRRMPWKLIKSRIRKAVRHVPSIHNRKDKATRKGQPEGKPNSQQCSSIQTTSAPSSIDVGDIAGYVPPDVSGTPRDIETALLFQGSRRIDIESGDLHIDVELGASKKGALPLITSSQALNLPSLDDHSAYNLQEPTNRIGNSKTLSSLFITADRVKMPNLPVTGGCFADIFMGTYGGTTVAVKAIRLFAFRGEAHKMYQGCYQEALAWKHLSHQHMLPFLGVLNETSQHRICLIFPWKANGNIKQYLENHEANPLHLLSEAVNAMQYLHSVQVVHGDLKPANILIDDNGAALLADLGLSTLITSRSLNTSRQFDGQETSRWMAPELFSDGSIITRASDVYAFGMTIYEVLSGNIPFEGMGEFTVIANLVLGQRPARPDKPLFSIEDTTWQLIEKCWHVVASSRPSIEEIANIIRELATQRTNDGVISNS